MDTMIDSNFSLQELNKVIDAQKNNKAPGSDNCTAELIKWLDRDNRGKLLDNLSIYIYTYNNILDSDVYPESLKLANIVSIKKRKCHQNAELPHYSTTSSSVQVICCDD